MKTNHHAILCVFIAFVFFLAGFHWYEVFPKESMSNEEVYLKLLEEYEFYMKAGGMWDKKVSDVPVHMSNHKSRVMFKIETFRKVLCNATE